MDRVLMLIGALAAAAAVIVGAFGAHALAPTLSSDALETYQTGARYHLAHAVALVMIGLAARSGVGRPGWLLAAGWTMLAGTVLFSGSLYVLAIAALPGAGFVTPLGGLALIAAWLLFAVGVTKNA